MGDPEMESSQPNDCRAELERLKKESSEMINLLKDLENEERDLAHQNEILAREALLCGLDVRVLEPPAPKRRKTAVKKNETPISS